MKGELFNAPLLFSRAETERKQAEIRHAVLMCWVWQCATVAAVLFAVVAGLKLWRLL